VIARDLQPQPSLAVRVAATMIRRLPMGRHRAAQWVSSRGHLPFWAKLPRLLGSPSFLCDLSDPLMREAYLTGRYEPQETAIIRDLLRPGMTFVDVGANWGYFTLVGAHATGPHGRVVCVEADPDAVRAIRANVEANAFATVRVFGVAATDTPRQLHVKRYEPARATSSGNYGVAQTPTPEAADVIVAGRPLDDVLDEAAIEHVDVLKMDIVGGEAAALRGLSRRLSDGSIDHIVLEVHPAALAELGTSAAAVCATLQGAGFDGWLIEHSLESHYRAASPNVDVRALLTPLDPARDFGPWPHVLWRRRGLSRSRALVSTQVSA
jgi:FkbM family methyltransferase